MSLESTNETVESATPEAAATSASEAKARKSLDDRIEETEAELRRLKDARRKKEQADRERNEREVLALLVAEKVIATPSAVWRRAMADIKTALERASGA